VVAVARRNHSLRFAQRLGATHSVQFTNPAIAVQEVRSITAGIGADCVIEAAGTQQSLDLATELTKERGRLVIAGYHQDGARQVNMQLWNWRGLDVINAHERDTRIYLRGMKRAVELIDAGLFDPDPLFTHRFKLEELDKAFQIVTDRPSGFVKALVMA
jgi:threonine dehydrogenase-like Zn-dependent dehydrogenase